ncbi:hypothetical protein BTN33_12705 [Aeromonas veronii]|uniref:ABC transporter ATP-binding protein n=1 Tax=Aeromonas veronii TaxID=654 RepID=UPI000947280E|nr:ABC transporter ATP-binding protein [Aeromonas veronii]OLF58446.1 hypothetical protein BTN33_12705 [Aeromonas veronii]
MNIAKTKENTSIIHYIWRMIGITAKEMPFHFALNIATSLLLCVSFLVVILASEALFNKVAVAKGLDSKSEIVTAILILGGAYVFNQLMLGIQNFLYSVRSTRLTGILRDILHKKSSSIEAIHYENPKFLDTLEKAKKGSPLSVFASDLTMVLLTFYIPYFIFMAVYLGSRSKLLLVSLLLIFVPVILAQILRMRLFEQREDVVAPLRRKMEAREMEMVDRLYFKDTRLLGCGSFIQSLYKKVIGEVNQKHWNAEKRSLWQSTLLNSLTVVGYVGILVLLVYLCLTGEITVGSFVAIFSSLGTLYFISEQIVGDHIGSIAENAAYIRNLVDFLELDEKQGEKSQYDPTQGIKVNNLTFRYPGADKDSLRNISLTINPGEVIAIVGDNGAGKSTLVKLLSGLYKPTTGKVSVGGLDTSTTHPESVYRGISAVFQDFNCYQMTLKQNIEIADPEVGQENQQNKLGQAIEEAELELPKKTFNQGIDTMLSREFDGVDLSGGQWQRIAIARGLYRDSHLMILDEPTKAIDPIEESRLYQKFAQIAEGKTAIIVTHRMGSTRLADRIIVLKNGEIEDIGTFDELMSRESVFSTMHKSQASWYM